MADISEPALEKAAAKLKQLVPSAHKVEVQVRFPSSGCLEETTDRSRYATSLKRLP